MSTLRWTVASAAAFRLWALGSGALFLVTGAGVAGPNLSSEVRAMNGNGNVDVNDKAPALQTFEGVLKTGVMAIGAETTGVILKTAAGGVYELELKTPALKEAAEKLNGKKVTVEGIYKPRPGVEIKERRIIEVSALAAAP